MNPSFAKQEHPYVTVDGILELEGKVVLIRRKNQPFKGSLALPGGFVELGETLEEAVVREFEEETCIKSKVLRLVGVYSDPSRDPRGHTISLAYELSKVGGLSREGSDASSVELVSLTEIPTLAFDHNTILSDYMRLKRS